MKENDVFRFKNLSGICFSGNVLVYPEYIGQDILFRHQFKHFVWYGADAEHSWQGHQTWVFDRALLISNRRYEYHIGNIFSTGQVETTDNILHDFTRAEVNFEDLEESVNPWNLYNEFLSHASESISELYRFHTCKIDDIKKIAAEHGFAGELLLNEYRRRGLLMRV
jgi:hypothetical protein